jgi:hypothetical protein
MFMLHKKAPDQYINNNKWQLSFEIGVLDPAKVLEITVTLLRLKQAPSLMLPQTVSSSLPAGS